MSPSPRGAQADAERPHDVVASTEAQSPNERRAVRAHWLRRVSVAALTVIVIVAVSGLVDREVTRTVQNAAGDELELTQAHLLRPGVDLSVEFSVRSDSPEVTIVVPRRMLEELGIDQLWPEPDVQATHGPHVYLTFDNPRGEVAVEAVGRLSTTAGAGRLSYTVTAVEAALEQDVTMWVLP